jgi:hypothetical protein
MAGWLAKPSEQRQVAAASVSPSGRKKRRNKGKEKKRKRRGLLTKKMDCTRLGQAEDLGHVRKSGLGREE